MLSLPHNPIMGQIKSYKIVKQGRQKQKCLFVVS